ncbi:FAD-dependent oxidoreductase [Dactylosporangium sp. CS-033363]|uniref:FAD-dependent oxidoreductase n=1 Tax=Dactylosporangium sp. CS-033363 TaxID=3239935 RepID=UPI003D8EFDD8
MHAIVVGGGIGGLATARGLGQRGWDVTVLERQPRIEAVGAGLSLWPNALRALDWLGVGDRVRAAGRPILGSAVFGVHRADLHEILGAGLTVHTGTTVTDVRELEADLVVGADGISSAVRAEYAPEVRIRDSGQVSWRAVVAPDPSITGGGETMGPGGRRFGFLPLGTRGIYWYAAVPAPLRTTPAEEQLAELSGTFAGWHEPIPRLVAATDPGALLHHPLLDLDPVAPMRFGDHIALVGDAAHAMTPNLGQGACQALEDAVTLAIFVSRGVTQGLREYDRIRRPRVAQIAKRSWQVGRIAGATNPIVNAALRTVARLTPERVMLRGAERIAAWEPPA